jgi:hypothetical protein
LKHLVKDFDKAPPGFDKALKGLLKGLVKAFKSGPVPKVTAARLESL